MSFKTTQPFEIDYVVRQWLTTRLEKKNCIASRQTLPCKNRSPPSRHHSTWKILPLCPWHTDQKSALEPVPENRYYKPARKYSMLPETGIPEKFGTKLHARRVRNRYRFFGTGYWRRLLVSVSWGIKPRFMWLITSWSLVSATSKL